MAVALPSYPPGKHGLGIMKSKLDEVITELGNVGSGGDGSWIQLLSYRGGAGQVSNNTVLTPDIGFTSAVGYPTGSANHVDVIGLEISAGSASIGIGQVFHLSIREEVKNSSTQHVAGGGTVIENFTMLDDTVNGAGTFFGATNIIVPASPIRLPEEKMIYMDITSTTATVTDALIFVYLKITPKVI